MTYVNSTFLLLAVRLITLPPETKGTGLRLAPCQFARARE